MNVFSTRRRRLATAASAVALVALPLGTTLAATASDHATGVVLTAGRALTVRAEPTTQSAAIGKRANGATVAIVCQTYGESVTGRYGTTRIWDRLKAGGFVSDAFVNTGSDGLVAPLCKGADTPPTPAGSGTPAAKVRATIAAARSMAGRYPYSWGGGSYRGATTGICCSPSGIDDRRTVGFDCSGLMEYAYFQGAGLRVSSTSRSQYADGPRVPISQLKAGDMVFWGTSTGSPSSIHHVAIYAGDGQIVEATRASGPDIRVRSFSTSERGVMPYVVRPIR
jgi:cell wall-associated NlpC family hydrolase